ncbi:envelope integrity protein Cei [Mycobacteroides salmoniphilum]|uniref:envelope integrity protein Cei n=1 Tax=Mycobacteroides salmoniphilum TaxID=404941 RepID=UPI00099250EF|nr:envelope integrity protein Cei [Mycobacteroides salmoniphilum]
MVADITEGTSVDKYGRPFRRRNYLPALCVGIALLVVTVFVWASALTREAPVKEATACNPPAQQTEPGSGTLGKPVSRSALSGTTPATLNDVKARVLNANGQAGQAGDVSTALRDLGFPSPTADNDPFYPSGSRLNCVGQIRFGESGYANALTLSLVAPCVEFVEDTRSDSSVDLALGSEFTELASGNAVTSALNSLKSGNQANSDFILKARQSTC